MPRNGSGTMSVPNTFTSNTTISSSAVNANFSDIGTEITGSLPRDGQAGMTGQLKAATGTAAEPGMAFNSDTNTGFFLKSGDTIGVAAGGVEVGTIGGTGFSTFPAGTVMLFAQTTAPTGWTKSTTHNNKALRVVSGTASSGGSTAFSSVFTARTIATANLPAHSHAMPHTHTFADESDTESAGHQHPLSGGSTDTASSHQHTVAYSTASITYQSGNNNATVVTAVGSGGSSANTGAAGSHSHGLSGNTGDRNASHLHNVSGTTGASSAANTADAGSGTAMDFAVQYVDVILATKA